MTKKDYVIIADAFSQARNEIGQDRDMLGGLFTIQDILVKTLKKDNPRFNEDKFIEYINDKIK